MGVRRGAIIVLFGVLLAVGPQFLYGYDPYPLPSSTYNQTPPSPPRPEAAQRSQKPLKEDKCVKKQQKWVLKLWS